MTNSDLRGIVACVCGGRACGVCPLYGDCVAPSEKKAISVARNLLFARDETLSISLNLYKDYDKDIYMSFVKHIMGVKYT